MAVTVSCRETLICLQGRIFLHCLLDLIMTVEHLQHHIQISREAHLDIIWWHDFLPTWLPGLDHH